MADRISLSISIGPSLSGLPYARKDGGNQQEDDMKIDGGCHCGAVTYEAELDQNKVGICHCTDCQTLSATAFRTVAMVPEEDLKLTGTPKVYIKTGDSGAKREQAFCAECGSAIYATSVGDGPKVYNLRVGTIRQRAELVPKVQYWGQSALNWLKELDKIPMHEKAAP